MGDVKKKLVLPCLRGLIGDWVYYSSMMTLEQISERIKPAKDIREAKKLDEILQHDLKERKFKIAEYLLHKKSRFFNSIVVGVFDGIPDWNPFDVSKKIKTLDPSLPDDYLNECMGLLVFNGDEHMFAIDGQHRVAGIDIAWNKYQKGEYKKPVEEIDVDQYSVIFVAHIDDVWGRKRTRRLFSDINKNAKPVAKGDRIKIDEDDICAIVTRKIYAEYEFFQHSNLIGLTESTALERDDIKHFTNL